MRKGLSALAARSRITTRISHRTELSAHRVSEPARRKPRPPRRRQGRRADRRDRPSTRRSSRSTTCRIRTKRSATSARCRTAGNGDRSAPCTLTSTANTSGPAIAAAATCAWIRTIEPMVKLDPTGKVVASFGAGQILWPHGMDVDKQGNIWVADARSATPQELAKFPGCQGQGPHRAEVQPARQAADDDRHRR